MFDWYLMRIIHQQFKCEVLTVAIVHTLSLLACDTVQSGMWVATIDSSILTPSSEGK
jgi:hypothetical protein